MVVPEDGDFVSIVVHEGRPVRTAENREGSPRKARACSTDVSQIAEPTKTRSKSIVVANEEKGLEVAGAVGVSSGEKEKRVTFTTRRGNTVETNIVVEPSITIDPSSTISSISTISPEAKRLAGSYASHSLSQSGGSPFVGNVAGASPTAKLTSSLPPLSTLSLETTAIEAEHLKKPETSQPVLSMETPRTSLPDELPVVRDVTSPQSPGTASRRLPPPDIVAKLAAESARPPRQQKEFKKDSGWLSKISRYNFCISLALPGFCSLPAQTSFTTLHTCALACH